jgi:arginyl-tRNA synthetase
MENPVYYVQYAHARISNIVRKAEAERLGELSDPPLDRLAQPDEIALVRRLCEFPDVVAGAAEELEPHRVTFYLLDLAAAFHGYYNKKENRVVGDDRALSLARLALVGTVAQVIRSGLDLLGVTAPERM